MVFTGGCPRCSTPVREGRSGVLCPVHGDQLPLWRPPQADYEHFADMLGQGDLPAYVPWPMSPRWSLVDFGWVGAAAGLDGVRRGTVTSIAGSTGPDGAVELTIVVEEPGLGLGARCAGLARPAPPEDTFARPAEIRVRASTHAVPMWAVEDDLDQHDEHEATGNDQPLGRAVFAGSDAGRWLWLVVRPGSAALLLRDEWLLSDVAELGPQALELPFGPGPAAW